MFVRLSAAIAALGLLTGGALAQGAKPTDPQIAHIAYTAGVIDINAAKQAKAEQQVDVYLLTLDETPQPVAELTPDRLLDLVAPLHPSTAGISREQLKVRPEATLLDQVVDLVRLSRMLALLARDQIDLGPAGVIRSHLPARAKQDQLGHVAEIETDAAAIGAAVLSNLVPNQIGFVGKAPRLHHR